MWLKFVFCPKGGRGVPVDSKVSKHCFCASKPPKRGGGVRANPKVLRQFWDIFEAVLRQKTFNISSISHGLNDFTHHQFKDYDVLNVKQSKVFLKFLKMKNPKTHSSPKLNFWGLCVFGIFIFQNLRILWFVMATYFWGKILIFIFWLTFPIHWSC